MLQRTQGLKARYPMIDQILKLKERILAGDPSFNNETMIRTLIAIGALASMFLPWAVLDGKDSSLRGSELLAYAFTSPERGAMFRTSFLGTMGLLFIPLTVTITSIIAFFKAVTKQASTAANLIGCLLPIIMIMVTGSITSSDRPDLLGVRIPEWGIAMMISCHAVLLVHGLIQENDRR